MPLSPSVFFGRCIFGRCERIRTFDPLHPMQVRYQAAPHTEAQIIAASFAHIVLL